MQVLNDNMMVFDLDIALSLSSLAFVRLGVLAPQTWTLLCARYLSHTLSTPRMATSAWLLSSTFHGEIGLCGRYCG